MMTRDVKSMNKSKMNVEVENETESSDAAFYMSRKNTKMNENYVLMIDIKWIGMAHERLEELVNQTLPKTKKWLCFFGEILYLTLNK